MGTETSPSDRDDVRPYWGEEPEVLGEWSLHWTHVSEPGRGTIGGWLDRRVAAMIESGLCPWCSHDLDQDLFCQVCGKNAAARRERREWTPEQMDDYMPRLPHRSLFDADEYAPAAVDEDAA